MQRGEGVVEGGREEGFVRCNKSCLYVCCKNENKKNDFKKSVNEENIKLIFHFQLFHLYCRV